MFQLKIEFTSYGNKFIYKLNRMKKKGVLYILGANFMFRSALLNNRYIINKLIYVRLANTYEIESKNFLFYLT